MYERRSRIFRACIDIAMALIGLALLTVLLTSAQTSLSAQRQTGNSRTKLEIACQRLANNAEEANENLATYDAFNQAKADTIAWFLDTAAAPPALDLFQAQFQLRSLAVRAPDGQVTAHAGQSPVAITDTPGTLADGTRWYASTRTDGSTLLLGVDFSAEQEKLATLTSAGYALASIKVGTSGYVAAIDTATGAYVYHPDHFLIGQTAAQAELRASHMQDGFSGWITRDGERFFCMTRTTGELTLVAVVPEAELAQFNRQQVLMIMAIYLIVVSLLIAYGIVLRRTVGSAREFQKIGPLYFNRTLAGKIYPVAGIMLIVIMLLTFYTQTLAGLSRQSAISDAKLDAVTDLLDGNETHISDLRDEYTVEYSRRAENIAWLLAQDPSMVDNDRLRLLAQCAQVNSIYIFDKYGHTAATNTVYTDFVLSEDPEAQSYAFWDVIKGYKPVLSQDAQVDDTSEHAYLQYVGVTRQDAPGMVQLGLLPQRLAGRLATTQISYVLANTAVENGGFLFAVDGDTHEFLSYPKEKYIGRNAEEYGVSAAACQDDFSGFLTVDTTACFVTCREYNHRLLFIAVPTAAIYQSRLPMTLVTGAAGFVVLLLLACMLVFSRHPSPHEPPVEANANAPRPEPAGQIEYVGKNGRTRRTVAAAHRWSNAGIAWHERTPEQKLMRLIYYIVSAAALGMVLILMNHSESYSRSSILSYILHRQWEKAPSIFSFTYIAIVLMEVWVVTLIARKLLLLLCTRFGARSETVGRLLDNFIKYISIIGALFYCLNFVGIDSTTLLTSAGLLTLIIGLGSESLIGDILAGIFIVFEGEFRVGDIVTIGDWRGTVLEIGIRTTKIEDAGGNIKIFSNSGISGVVNMTKQYSYALCDVGVEYGESLEKIEAVLKEELPRFKERISSIQGGPFYKGVVSLADSAVVIRIIAQCSERDRVQLTRDLNREIKLVFDRHGIGIPFPQVVVNQPTVYEKATTSEEEIAKAFVNEQKELSKDIHARDD